MVRYNIRKHSVSHYKYSGAEERVKCVIFVILAVDNDITVGNESSFYLS